MGRTTSRERNQLIPFTVCGPPQYDFVKIKVLHKKVNKENFARIYQETTDLQVAVSTSTVESQTPTKQLKTTARQVAPEVEESEVQPVPEIEETETQTVLGVLVWRGLFRRRC